MKIDLRTVLAHPTVQALEPEKRTAYAALLRASSEPWGEIEDARALSVVRSAISSSYRARFALSALHNAGLLSRQDKGALVVWTPAQRADADVFAEAERDAATPEWLAHAAEVLRKHGLSLAPLLDATTNSTDESEAL